MRVLVCGGRYYDDQPAMFAALDDVHAQTPISILIQGGQRHWKRTPDNPQSRGAYIGADWLAEEWARSREVPCLRVPAEWKKRGKPAGPIRNSHQLEIIGLPDLLVTAPGGDGTADMVKRAKAARVRVMELLP